MPCMHPAIAAPLSLPEPPVRLSSLFDRLGFVPVSLNGPASRLPELPLFDPEFQYVPTI